MSDHEYKIKCIVCSKELENYSDKKTSMDRSGIQPSGGLHFRTYGHYGSTIFDPVITDEWLDIAICDECVMENVEKVYGQHVGTLDGR